MSKPQGPRSIAIVDDDAFMIRLLSALVARVGDYAVQGFTDGASARAAMEAGGAGFDIVILDLNMPGMDGIELLHHLARSRAQFSVILFSGESGGTLRSAGRIASAQGLAVLGTLSKPPSLDALTRLLLRADQEQLVASMTDEPLGPEELLGAIASGEIFCAYQPVADLHGGRVVGADARLRWNHPQFGAVGPNTFMRMAQRAGMGGLLVREALEMSLAAQRRWREAGWPLRVAIRAGEQALAEQGFADFVAECAQRHGATPGSVVLRLRTSDIVDPGLQVAETLARLRMRKFELALDDFGVGGMPLLQLVDLGLSAVRVAPALSEYARDAGAGLRVLQACADVASRLGLRAVAGGAQSPQDLALCRDAGFDLADGPAVGAPLEASALLEWLQGAAGGKASTFS